VSNKFFFIGMWVLITIAGIGSLVSKMRTPSEIFPALIGFTMLMGLGYWFCNRGNLNPLSMK
jgi:hypothetical protein